tara:strand:- start:996 stop:1286 length:291 start_codon:yes stop_codon:yes gene_type:complete
VNKDQSQRLDRIEEKIDKLADAIISIARAEEKITNMQEDQSNFADKLIIIDDRYRELVTRTLGNEQKLSTITKMFWIVITAVVTTATAATGFLTGE